MNKKISLFKKKILIQLILFFLVIMVLSSCKKYLDVKTDQKINTPSTLDDLNQLLNFYGALNGSAPVMGEISSDDYYLTDADWASSLDRYRSFYIWAKEDDIKADWSFPYGAINYANVILDYLPKVMVKETEKELAKEMKGAGLFTRGFYHFTLSQLFAPIYNASSSSTDLGIPLRLTSDINEKSVRSTVAETYNSIINDINEAIPLLPVIAAAKSRPCKPAAYGLLARLYVTMREYNQAKKYADSCLQLYDSLIDYNTLNVNASIPFAKGNKEVIYDNVCTNGNPLTRAKGKIDSILYNSYANDDIRKTIFFITNKDGTHGFKGNYTGVSTNVFFTGIAVDEIYFIRMECNAREGNTAVALADLNLLLSKRWKTGKFVPLTVTNNADLLKIILSERRKQLLSRTLRWSDLRRFSVEPERAITIYRKLNGQEYKLEPGSPRYTIQLSRDAVALSGMQQNP